MDTCHLVRESLSARADGEEALLDVSSCDRHLAGCDDCRDFHARLGPLIRATRVRAAEPVPDLTAAILAAAAEQDLAKVAERHLLARRVLVVVGLVQVLVAGLALVGDLGHVARELAAWEVAMGVGFVVAAAQPHRATGLVPVVGVLALVSVVGSLGDLASGATTFVEELQHLPELLGVWLAVTVSRGAGDEPLALPSLHRR